MSRRRARGAAGRPGLDDGRRRRHAALGPACWRRWDSDARARREPRAVYVAARRRDQPSTSCWPDSAQEMAEALQWAAWRGVAVRVIGGGSNLLVAEAGVDGLVIKPVFAHERASKSATVNPCSWPRRARTWPTRRADWQSRTLADWNGRPTCPVPWAARPSTTRELLAAIPPRAYWRHGRRCVTARAARLGVEALQYGYRTSVLKRRELGDVAVERVEWRLQPCPAGEADARVKAVQCAAHAHPAADPERRQRVCQPARRLLGQAHRRRRPEGRALWRCTDFRAAR